LVVVAATLATLPVLEMGTNDDWSYAWIVRELASTGHFRFNGWVAAMIGFQAVWAAAWVRLFGFSFTLIRISTLPFAAGCAVLMYAIGRRVGLNPAYALFGAWTLALSPVFIPLAASFMTDVPACCFWLASAYCALRAIQVEENHAARRWLVACGVAGFIGGTIRQVDWFIPIFTIPVIAWMRRRERPLVLSAAVIWCASGALMWITSTWFAAQPFAVAPALRIDQSAMEAVQRTIETVDQIAVEALLLAIPVLLASTGHWRKSFVIGASLTGVLLLGLWWFGDALWIGNVLTSTGIMGSLDLPGQKPVILPDVVTWILGPLLIIGTGSLVFARGLTRLYWVLGPPSLVYASALVYRSVGYGLFFDRYLILLMPLLLLPALRGLQDKVSTRPPVSGWLALAVCAAFGIAMTHDYFAVSRARLAAANRVAATGVPRTQLSAGFEYDAWTELELRGRILSPAEQEAVTPPPYPTSEPFWAWPKLPMLRPRYVVSYSPLAGMTESRFPRTAYTTWLPPFRRELLTLTSPSEPGSSPVP
jgi:hypothetical protein